MGDMNDVVNVASSAVSQHDFSFLSLFAQASFTVKLVIILLLACSFWSWTVIFAKSVVIKKLKERADAFEKVFWNSNSIDLLFDNINYKNVDSPVLAVFISGMKEWRRGKKRSMSVMAGMSLSDRISCMMHVTLLGFLATVGSTAPFVGLFGTVWGIMNSFESIGMDQNTSLTSVAPGIAEALFATALGLVVTIPSVVAYNKISLEINKYQARVEAFIDEFLTMISRHMDDSAEGFNEDSKSIFGRQG